MRNAATSTAVEIPGYSVERLIGRGGMSSVYLGVQRSLGRRVALKVLKRFDNPGQTNRFLHEGRIIAALNHRNIITIHDIGTIGERHYIAMEYLRGRSLAERIAKGVPLPKALSLLEQLAACLHFVHKRGIVHRDIKPGNIMFHADGTPKLTDFGIAKRVHSNQELCRVARWAARTT
jgi:serine/threonine-protein kinase PpkA